MSKQLGLDASVSLQRLAEKAIPANHSETMKSLAVEHGIKPLDILMLMLGHQE